MPYIVAKLVASGVFALTTASCAKSQSGLSEKPTPRKAESAPTLSNAMSTVTAVGTASAQQTFLTPSQLANPEQFLRHWFLLSCCEYPKPFIQWIVPNWINSSECFTTWFVTQSVE